jgi:histone demethylase JARID1
MQSRGQSVTRWPVFGGKKLDLQALYDNVTQRGGFDAVCRAKGWRDMARVMDTPATVTSAAMALRALYQKWLLDFEQHKARQENLSPAGKAKEAAQTKKEQERLAREEKSKELKDRARRDSIGVEEDLIEALFELGNAAAPPPRAKLEMVRPIPPPRAPIAPHPHFHRPVPKENRVDSR